jgi:hypothetical protein
MTKAQQAQRDYDAARAHLRKLAGVDGGRRQWHYTPANSYANGDQASNTNRPGMFDVQFGVEPSPAEIQAYVRYLGGDRAAKKSKVGPNSTPSAGGAAPAPAGGESVQAVLARLAADYKSQQDRANAANEGRYQQVLGNQDALYGRVMGEVDNWGGVQSELNEEKARESMGNIRGNLASRGLTDSSIGEAFQARNDRDLRLQQMALSEAKSARRLGYDTDLTRDTNSFIERRTDRAPDNSALLALAAKLGEAEAYQRGQQMGSGRQRGPRTQPQRISVPQGVNPAYASTLAAQMQGNFTGQLGGAMNSYLPVGAGPAYTSNRYPTPRGTRRASNAAQQAIPMIPALGGGIGGALGSFITRMR